MEFPKIPRTGLGLRDVFTGAFMSDPDWRSTGKSSTPLGWLFRGSPLVNALSQVTPQAIGGLGKKRLDDFDLAREEDPEMRRNTLRIGDYPELDDQPGLKQGPGVDAARRGAQFAGAAAKDFTTQGLQNIWWFLNAYEAASMMGGRQALHGALSDRTLPWERPIEHAPQGSPFSRHSLRFAAAFPLVLGAASATGTLFRQPGYAAVLPGEEDPRQSENSMSEAFMRAVGRSGKLLPYDEFAQERPDVSRDEYESYKAFLHGNKDLIKVTGDGIHGPEINFVGKSVPLLTGILPVVGGIVGGRAGLRFAGEKLASSSGNQFKALELAKEKVNKIKTDLTVAKAGYGREEPQKVQERLERAVKAYTSKVNQVEGALLAGTIGGSSAGLITTGAGAALLEQIRRAANAEENRQKQSEELTPVEAY
jgi:hypothetical protein